MYVEFERLIYYQFVLIYGDSMKYEKGKVGVYQLMINNYLKQQANGKKIYLGRNNQRSNN